MEPLPTKKRWRLLSKGGYHPGGCHGHQFDTEDEAKAWIAQPYVAGSYTYDCVDVIQCTRCKQWHIAIDGLQGVASHEDPQAPSRSAYNAHGNGSPRTRA